MALLVAVQDLSLLISAWDFRFLLIFFCSIRFDIIAISSESPFSHIRLNAVHLALKDDEFPSHTRPWFGKSQALASSSFNSSSPSL